MNRGAAWWIRSAGAVGLVGVVMTSGGCGEPAREATGKADESALSSAAGNLVQNGSFESGLSPWSFVVRGGAAATQAEDGSTAEQGSTSERVTITTSTPSTPWNVQLQQSGIALQAGQAVTVSFWAKASSARSITCVLQQSVSPWGEYVDQSLSLTTSWAYYSFEYTPTATDNSALFDLNFAQAAGEVWVDAVSIAPLLTNVVQNGSFESGLSPWSFVVRGGAAATQAQDNSVKESGSYSERITVTTATSSEPWDVQLAQTGIPLTAGEPVTVSLWARASTPSAITCALQQNVSPWGVYIQQTLNVTESWASYSFPFTPTTTDGQALFDLNFAGHTGSVWIDNISISGAASSSSNPPPPPPPPPCTPTTCAAKGASCGTIPNGCGGTLSCGSCAAPETCGGGGTANVCATASLAPPAGYSATQLVFDDKFGGSALDTTKWNTFMTSNSSQGAPWFDNGAGGSAIGGAGTFNAEYMSPKQVSVASGLLFTAIEQSTESGFPWTSGVISSYGKFEFNGGYVQIRMLAPSGDGMWPGLWMLPGPGAGNVGNNFEIDIQEGGFFNGSSNPNNNAAWHEHVNDSQTCGGVTTTAVDLTAGYHTYGVQWVPGQLLTYYLDGVQTGQITPSECPIANEPMELILNLSVAGSPASSWRSVYDSSTPSPSVMKVSEVQVYQ